MTRLGQHFLKNSGAITKIVRALEIGNADVVIEIGPGHGELTFPLAKACEATGGHVIAIEKDPALAAELEARAKSEGCKNITVVQGDALKILGIEVDRLGAAPYKLAGNIPYYITGKLFRAVGELSQRPERSVFTIQREVAERICSIPPRMNRLAASIQFWAAPKIIALLSPQDFSPPPKVESAVILLSAKNDGQNRTAPQYYAAVRALFAQPRKTILNNLTAKLGGASAKQNVLRCMEKLSIAPGARPQNLTAENIAAIAETLFGQ